MKNTILFISLLFSSITFVANAQIMLGGDEPDSTSNTQVIGSQNVEVDYESPKEYTIGPINVIGAEGYDVNAIRLVSGLRSGQKIVIPGTALSDAIKALWKEDLFSDVQLYADKELAGVIYLTIKVTPRPKLAKYKFNGVKKREADKIREQINLFTGKTISENVLFTTRQKVIGYFREEGYYDVKVNIQRKPDDMMLNSEVFIIDVNKGKKVGIKDIVIHGNESLSDSKIRRAMKDTKKKSLLRIFKKSKFSEAAFKRDKAAVISKLNTVGLRDAKIVKDSVYLVDPKNLVIELFVDEGDKYYFGDISWVGNTKFRSSFLDTILGIKPGDIYNKELLEQRVRMSQDGRDISSLYMDRGYLFFDINPVEVEMTDNRISYEMRIREGKEARVGKVIIKGNTKTNDHVILREIRTKPGDLFSRNDIIRTQRELSQLGYFNDQAFQVNPIPDPQRGTVDIEYTVEEKSSDQIELSGGYGGQNIYYGGRPVIMATVGVVFNNFSLRNMFNGSAWSPLPAGDGQRLSVRGQTNGKYYQAYNFSFTEPWLGGRKPTSLTVFGTHQLIGNGQKRSSGEYAGVAISGAGVAIGRRLKIPDDYFSESWELGYQYYNVDQSKTYQYVAFDGVEKGYFNDISLKYTIQRNSISSPIYPASGSVISLSAKSTLPYSAFDKNADYASMSANDRYKYLEYFKIKAHAEWFFPMTSDGKLVLRTRVGFGYMGAYSKEKGVNPFDRFYMGGSGLTGYGAIGGREILSLRGYDDRVLSSSVGDPIAAKYTVELRYPISLNPSATFYVLAFAEGGNTYPNFRNFNPLNVKKAAGVGLRIFLPMFGMLGIDYGWGFDQVDPWGYGNAGYDAINQSIRDKGYYGKFTFTIGMNMGDL